MAYIPESGSVVAFQGNPSVLQTLTGLMSTNASVITVGTAAANQSVSGTVGASVIGHAPVVIVGGSILTSSTANQSVSGTVQTEQTGTTITSLVSTVPSSVIVGASIFGLPPVNVTNTNLNIGGSVVAFQGGVPWANTNVGSVIVIGQSSYATVIIGGSIATATTNSSVMLLNGENVIGSVTALQGTNPWVTVGSVSGALNVSGSVLLGSSNASVITASQGSVGAVIIGGSIATATTNSSVMLLNGANTIGSVTALQGTNPWVVVGSVYGSGSVVSFQGGTQITSLVSTVPSSVIVGASIFGQLPAGTAPLGSVATLQGTNPWVVVGSVYGSGSTVAFQGGAPWANTNVGSIITTQIGSVIAVLQAASIVGTYAEDAAHTTADKGFFVLGVRNDAVSSITSAERDYSPLAVDEAGRVLFKPFAGSQACIISYTGSVVSGSVTLIKSSVIGSRSYITDYWVTNTGSVAQLITLKDGSTSVLGYTIAPAGGGSNSQGIAMPIRTALSQDLAFQATGTSSVIYMTVMGYQAP